MEPKMPVAHSAEPPPAEGITSSQLPEHQTPLLQAASIVHRKTIHHDSTKSAQAPEPTILQCPIKHNASPYRMTIPEIQCHCTRLLQEHSIRKCNQCHCQVLTGTSHLPNISLNWMIPSSSLPGILQPKSPHPQLGQQTPCVQQSS